MSVTKCIAIATVNNVQASKGATPRYLIHDYTTVVIKIFDLPQSTNWTALVTAAKKDTNMIAQTSFILLICNDLGKDTILQ